MTLADTLLMQVEQRFGGYWVRLDGVEWWGATFEEAYEGLCAELRFRARSPR